MSHSLLLQNADEYWKLPPARNKGNDNVAMIKLAIGDATTEWEGIEFSLVSLFCHFVQGRPSNAAARAYGAISSSRGRMEALENAAEVYFHLHHVSDDLQRDFDLMKNHFSVARGRRN